MKLGTINIEGFRSYRTKQSFDFADLAPGLYLIKGRNGAGKSSMLEAVNWLAFEQTSRGLKAGNVRTWKSDKPCQGSLVVDGLTIERAWPPRSLQLDGTVVTQEELEKRIRVTPAVAQHLFHFSQFEDFFIDLKPSPRMELYAEVIGLTFWDEKADKAGELAKKAAKGVQAQEVEVAKLEERIKTLQELDLSEQIEEWEKQRSLELRKAAKFVETRRKELADAKKAGTDDKPAALKAQLAVTEAKKIADETSEAEVGKMNEVARLLARVSGLKHVLNHDLEQQVERFNKVGVGECFVCGQTVTAQHRKKHLASLAVKKAETQEHLAAAREAVEVAQKALTRFTTAKRKAQAELDAAKSQVTELSSRARERDREVRRAQEDLEAAEAVKDKLDKAVNPYRRQQRENEQDIKDAKLRLRKAKDALLEDQETIAALTFWQKGFKDIRFDVIKSSLIQLNAEVNESLHAFGLEGWEMRFEVEQETKAGSVRKGFLCSVVAPGAPAEGVPWEAWSGGESQRLRLASQLGISNLIANFTGIETNVEFWDEPSAWLEEQGMKALLVVLQERAERYQRAILLADHKSLDFPFEGVIQVTKSERGSKWQLVES